ncbi:leucine-rich repeat domain-containing protein [Flavobacterium sp. SH_e]|uniref:leucine-rich repeat domain-containing protein n=1 Tax=Flavobacterium TaxID=237 RepID=UPI0021E4B58D|nr:leucine-rich repeat domain-containing protein [Flavobacterium sp. SH_e]MCV2487675.1 leucine-rich repeat domain-containing protein [Flavobacterium sp. SH_e]
MGLRKTIFGCQKVKSNTFIGGVADTINTPSLLASKLGINVSRIKGFKIVGLDIQCQITGNYTAGGFANDTSITYFHDLDGLVSSVILGGFQYATNLTSVKIKNATILNSFCFRGTALIGQDCDFSSITLANIEAFNLLVPTSNSKISLPNLISIGSNAFSGHVNFSNNVTIEVPLSFKTSNSGLPHSALTTASLRAVVINYIGFTDNNSYNTEIGGYSNAYSNKGLFAQFFGVGSGAIVNYHNEGANLCFEILINYNLRSFTSDSTITHFFDFDGRVLSIAWGGFQYCTNFKNIRVKNVTSLSNFQFRSSGLVFDNSDLSSVITVGTEAFLGCTSILFITLPLVNNLGGNSASNNVFTNIKTGATITVPIALQTINSGAPDGDLVYASGTRGATIIYV